MRATYKNKRDLYKTQAEMWKKAAEEKQKIIEGYEKKERKEKEAKGKRYLATVYCANCLEVNAITVPEGVAISEGDCVGCRVRGKLMLVKKVNCDRTF